MSHSTDPPPSFGTQGWKQFLTARREMLDAYDRAREKAKAHETETYHGKVAEAEFRKWLSGFLPKKYGVTAGYIISQGTKDDIKAPHFDVIIYNQHESPVLWIESDSDTSDHGRSLAIPAEHVQGVIEVKSSLNSTSSAKAIEHLFDLEPLLKEVDAPNERYKKFLPVNFFNLSVFFELRKENEFSSTALDNLVPEKELRGYYGSIILRGEGLNRQLTGKAEILVSETPLESTVGKSKESLITGSPLSNFRRLPNNYYQGAMLMWHESFFANFAFDLLALLNGTFQAGFVSSWHAKSWSRIL